MDAEAKGPNERIKKSIEVRQLFDVSSLLNITLLESRKH